MKKNKLMLTAAIAGSALLVTSIAGFAISGSGYQEFKKAVKTTAFLNNATISVDMELKDNGSIIMSGNSVLMDDNMQSDRSNSYTSSSFVVDGQTHLMETSSVDGRLITNVDGEYMMYDIKMPDNHGDMQAFQEDSSTMKLMELIVDTLVGDVRNQFVKNGDTVTVNLEGAQIPELARLGISAILENMKDLEGGSARNDSKGDASQALFNRIPQMETINVESLGLLGTIKDNILTDSSYQALVTGTDNNGVSHTFEINMTVKVSDVGTTVPKSIDITGKEVEHIQYFDIDATSQTIMEMQNNGASEEEIEAYIKEMHEKGIERVTKSVEIRF